MLYRVKEVNFGDLITTAWKEADGQCWRGHKQESDEEQQSLQAGSLHEVAVIEDERGTGFWRVRNCDHAPENRVVASGKCLPHSAEKWLDRIGYRRVSKDERGVDAVDEATATISPA